MGISGIKIGIIEIELLIWGHCKCAICVVSKDEWKAFTHMLSVLGVSLGGCRDSVEITLRLARLKGRCCTEKYYTNSSPFHLVYVYILPHL